MSPLDQLPKAEIVVNKLYEGAFQQLPDDRPFGSMRLVSSPEKVREMLSRPSDFGKHYGLFSELGPSRFDADDEEWEKRRSLTQPTYREAALTARHAKWASHYGEAFDGLPEGPAGTLEFALLCSAATILSAAFGAEVDGRPFAQWVLHGRPTAILAQRAVLYGASEAQLSELRARARQLRAGSRALAEQSTELSAQLLRMEQSMQGFPTDPGRDFDGVAEFMLAYLAGTETSISVISWAIFALCLFPDAQENLAADIAKHGAGSYPLEVFVQEVMRMRPPVPLITRRARSPEVTLAGKPVQPDTLLAIDIVGLHHSRAHWERPFEFQPERREFRNRSWNKRTFLPFSAGPRVCGGVGLARIEIHTALAELLSRFRLSYAGGPIPLEFALTLRPKNLNEIVLERRRGTVA